MIEEKSLESYEMWGAEELLKMEVLNCTKMVWFTERASFKLDTDVG